MEYYGTIDRRFEIKNAESGWWDFDEWVSDTSDE
jgi:hypothetical protein